MAVGPAGAAVVARGASPMAGSSVSRWRRIMSRLLVGLVRPWSRLRPKLFHVPTRRSMFFSGTRLASDVSKGTKMSIALYRYRLFWNGRQGAARNGGHTRVLVQAPVLPG